MTFSVAKCAFILPFIISVIISSLIRCDQFISSNEFTLYNGTTFALDNIQRDHEPTLWFALHGALVDKIDKINSTTRRFKLNDSSLLHLSIHQKPTLAVTQYYLIWHGGGPNEGREICFHYGRGQVYWYHTYQSTSPNWPMNVTRNLSKLYFNYLHDWRTSKLEYAHILEHLFVNSDGFAVLLDAHQPLFIRKDTNKGNPLLCFSVAKREPYAVSENDPSNLDLKIHLFASTNIRTVTDYVVAKSGLIPAPEMVPDARQFASPYWRLWGEEKTIEARLMEFVTKSRQHGFTSGQIEIDVMWKNDDFTLNTANLANFDYLLVWIRTQGQFQVMAPIIPDVLRQNSPNTEPYFVKDSSGKKMDFVDFSNPRAREWFRSILGMLHYEKGIDSFMLDSKTIAPGIKLHDRCAQRHPNELITKYLEIASNVGNNTSKLAFKTQHLPLFVQLWANAGTHPSASDLVRTLVSSVLPISVGGYLYVVPYKIAMKHASEELYIRWVQATALMPRMAFHIPPWEYSAKCVRMTKKFIDLHAKFSQVFEQLARKRVHDGSPIIRPLWYAAPNDARTYRIDDQFMLGDDYLVAPVLVEKVTARNVYLPAGVWTDQYGVNYTGPGDFSLGAPLDTLLYFKRS